MKIAITGGTGSLGRALLAKLATMQPERVVILSRDEHKQAEAAAQLGDPPWLRWFLGDVRDRERLVMAFRSVDLVVHAAALKRVDKLAYDPREALRTNVLGTQNVISAAAQVGVGKVIVISSDKAVHPANVYGASKQMAEFLAIQDNAWTQPQGTIVSVVRYGNVAGSRGSVLPMWKARIEAGRRPAITDPACTRFWITLPEAVDLVLWTAEHMRGGEIVLPRLPAFAMVDVVEAMTGARDFEVIGLRPGGEKLHEVLLGEDEARRVCPGDEAYSRVLVLPSHQSWDTAHRRVPQPWGFAPYESGAWPCRLDVAELRARVGALGLLP